MISISKHKKLPGKLAFLFMAAILAAGTAGAQEYDSLIAKYKNEDAAVINYTEHLVITNEGGELVATSYFNKEKLFVSDLSRGVYNYDYFFHSDYHELDDIRAWVWLPEKNGYRKVRCDNFAEINPEGGNVFFDDNKAIIVYYTGLLKNSVTHSYYSIDHTDPFMIPPFTYQENIPVDKAVYEVTVPKTINISFVLKGPDTGKIKQTKEEKATTITYRFTVNNVPPFKEFENVPSQMYYRNQIIPYITSYKLSESNKKVDVLANPDQLYKYMYKYVRNLNLKPDTLLDNTVAEITRKDVTPRDKAMHIYQWVQKNLHYIAFEKGLEGFVPREASKVLRRKYGDCKDMAGVLVTMCRKAGLDAYYVWIGTRDKPYFLNETPLPLVSDHMICAVKLGEEWVFMDGTHPYIPFGHTPAGIQGKEAMIAIDEKNYKIVTVPETPPDKNVVVDSTSITFSEKKLSGSVKQFYQGNEAWDLGIMRMFNKGDDWDKRIRALTMRGSDKYLHNKQVTHTGQTPDKEASLETDFVLDNYVQKVGKQYYINMNLKHTFEDKRIDTENRVIPYYFNYKQAAKEVVVLDVPKGFKVAHLPPSAHGSVDGLWSYNISYKANKKQVTLVKEYELNTLTTSPKLFADNNKMVDDLKNLYKETVVLTAK